MQQPCSKACATLQRKPRLDDWSVDGVLSSRLSLARWGLNADTTIEHRRTVILYEWRASLRSRHSNCLWDRRTTARKPTFAAFGSRARTDRYTMSVTLLRTDSTLFLRTRTGAGSFGYRRTSVCERSFWGSVECSLRCCAA